MKTLLLIISLSIIFFAPTVFAQTSNDNRAYLQIRYDEISISDTTNLQKKNYDVMGLEIGKSMSKFYSISLVETRKALEEQIKQGGGIDFTKLNTSKNKRGKDEVILKNYTTNQVSMFERLGVFSYTFQEPTPIINWQIQPDTMSILNYSCQKAICQFKGRIYEAWFTSSINVSDGPWKFTGLPGLILKVIESRGHFIFECKSIEKVENEISYTNSKAQKVSKEQILDLKKQYIDNPIPFMSDGKTGFTLDTTTPSTLPKRTYNPMELTEK